MDDKEAEEYRNRVYKMMLESGEKERLKVLLRNRLIESGWRHEVKMHCKDVVKQKGLEHITLDQLVNDITPKARAMVPDAVKKELLHNIKTYLSQQT